MTSISEYKVELGRLKKAVLGHMPEVAELSGLSVATVCRVLNGEWVNENVLKAARKVRDREKSKLDKLTKSIAE